VLTGVRTTLPFHRWLMRDAEFRAGNLSTAFIAERWKPDEMAAPTNGAAEAARLAGVDDRDRRRPAAASADDATVSRWRDAARRESLR
jgi:acetyl/propionyl-CoA carboxylase alpha subunit